MGKLMLTLVLIGVIGGGIVFLFRMLFSRRKLLENAKRRFDEALEKVSKLKEDYFVEQKKKDYEQMELYLLKHSAGSNPVKWYDRHADKLEEILEDPDTFLARKVYDPVDNSLLQEDAVEVVCDHPTAGNVYVMVNSWNVNRVDKIFSRRKKYQASKRFYRMRTERKLAHSDVTVIQQDDGITLTDILLLNYLLTDHHVHVHQYDEPAQIWYTHSDDDIVEAFSRRHDAGYEEPISHTHHLRPADDDDVIPTMAPSGDTGFLSRTFESEPQHDAPIEHNFGGGESGGGGASGSLDDNPVIIDPFEASHGGQESVHEAIETHSDDFHSSEPDTNGHESGSGTAY